jgi:hypothetical protein
MWFFMIGWMPTSSYIAYFQLRVSHSLHGPQKKIDPYPILCMDEILIFIH